MNLNELIAKIDLAPGAKTTFVAALFLVAVGLQWFGIITPEQFDWTVNYLISPALVATLGLKMVRHEDSPLITGAGLGAAAIAAASLFLGGCLLAVGPEGKYMHAELDPGVCMAANAGEYLNVGLGFCTEEGASTDSLEAPEDTEPEGT